jgi:Bacterial regulatory proteins, gntR family
VNPQSGRCLNVAGGSVADGARLQISDCDDTAGQIWGCPENLVRGWKRATSSLSALATALLLDRAGVETLTDQLAGQLRQAIATTQLPSGLRLSSRRRLAEQLEVARNTVIPRLRSVDGGGTD